MSQADLQRDMVVQARTGSGKTLAFLLPILCELEGGNKNPRVLVLSPTRELAMQNANESEFFGRIKGLGTAAIVGGMSMCVPLVIDMYYIFVEAWCLLYALQYLPVSWLLCRCYERCNSIWGSIFLHMTINAISIYALSALADLMARCF